MIKIIENRMILKIDFDYDFSKMHDYLYRRFEDVYWGTHIVSTFYKGERTLAVNVENRDLTYKRVYLSVKKAIKLSRTGE